MPSIENGRVQEGTGKVYLKGEEINTGVVAGSGQSSTTTQPQYGVMTVQGRNIGTGSGLYSGVNGSSDVVLEFRSLIAGPGIEFIEDLDTITIISNSNTQTMSFLQLSEAPDRIVGNGLLMGTHDGRLEFLYAPTVQNSVLVFNGVNLEWRTISQGTVRSVNVVGENGILATGAPITETGTVTVSLIDTGVTPGTYTAATITVDSTGRITSASSTPVGETNTASNLGDGEPVFAKKDGVDFQFKTIKAEGVATISSTDDEITIRADAVTHVELTAGPGISLSGTPITSSGSYNIALAPTGVAAGSYNFVQVDEFGRVVAASMEPWGEANTASNIGIGEGLFARKEGTDLRFKTIVGSGGIQITSTPSEVVISSTPYVSSVNAVGSKGVVVTGGPITNSGTFDISLSDTGVVAGTYTAATITVDEQGRIIAASNGSVGEVNTGNNLGNGAGVYAGKTGDVLEFRSIVAGDNITITEDDNTITIEATSPLSVSGFNEDNVDVPQQFNGTAEIRFGNQFAVNSAVAGTVDISLAPGVADPIAVHDENGAVVQNAKDFVFTGNVDVTHPDGDDRKAVVNIPEMRVRDKDGALASAREITFTNGSLTVDGAGRVSIDIEVPSPLSVLSNGTEVATEVNYLDIVGATVEEAPNGGAVITIDPPSRLAVTDGSTSIEGVNTIKVSNATVAQGEEVDEVVITALNPAIFSAHAINAVSESVKSITFDDKFSVTTDGNDNVTIGLSGSTVSGGINLGAGHGVFKDVLGDGLRFKSIRGSGVVTVTSNDNEIILSGNAVTSIGISGQNGIIATGGPITSTGEFIVRLSDTGITPGTYTAPTIFVDSTGRITSITSNVLGEANTLSSVGTGASIYKGKVGTTLQVRSLRGEGAVTVTQGTDEVVISSDAITAIEAGDGIAVTTDGGVVNVALAPSGVTAGSYSPASITIDEFGRIVGLVPGASQPGNGTVTMVDAVGENGITVSGGPIVDSGQFVIGLETTGVSAGTYSSAVVTVDEFGRITAISSSPVTAKNVGSGAHVYRDKTGEEFNFRSIDGNNGVVVTQGTDVVTVSLDETGVAAGTYTNATITVDAHGRVIAASTGTATSDVFVNVGSGAGVYKETEAGEIKLRSLVAGDGIDITEEADQIRIKASASGVTPGEYHYATVTVDETGRVTAISSNTAGAGTVTSIAVEGSADIEVTGSPITENGTIGLALTDTGVVPGEYNSVVVDAKGRVTAGEKLNFADIAFSGDYNDLINKPIMPNDYVDLTTDQIVNGKKTFNDDTVVNGLLTVTGEETDFIGMQVPTESLTANWFYNTNNNRWGSYVGEEGSLVLGDVEADTFYGKLAGTASEAEKLTTAHTITLAGPVSGSVTFDGSQDVQINTELEETGVVAGTYSYATITVDEFGRITSASNGAPVSGGGSGTVTSVGLVGTSDFVITGSPVTESGTFSIALSETGVSAGSYSKVMVDAHGRVIAGEQASASDITGLAPVAISGSYNDLTDKPMIPGAISDLVDDSDFVTHPELTSALSTKQDAIPLGLAGQVMAMNETGTGFAWIDAPEAGETTTASNVGSGEGHVFSEKVGADLRFKTIRAGANVTISETADEITIAAAGGSGGASTPVEKDGTQVVAAPTAINFTGPGVTVTNESGVATVNIPGGDSNEEIVVFRYSPGASGNFSSGDNVKSKTPGVEVEVLDGDNCIVKFNFTGKTRPPSSIAVMGQHYQTNQFIYKNVVTGLFATTKFSGGGTADNPTFMTEFTDYTIQLRMEDTGAGAGLGQRAHCAIIFKW